MTEVTTEDVEIHFEKPSRKDRFQRSLVARAHRKLIKTIKAIRETREEQEEEHLYQKHLHLMQDQKKKVRKTKNSS